MMKWTAALLFLCVSSVVWGAPATQIQVSYDSQAEMLHVQADHPTDRLDRYYIRRVLVRNAVGQEQSFDFTRQNAPGRFIADLQYKAEAGEHLDLELYSSEGGKASVGLNIPDAGTKGDK